MVVCATGIRRVSPQVPPRATSRASGGLESALAIRLPKWKSVSSVDTATTPAAPRPRVTKRREKRLTRLTANPTPERRFGAESFVAESPARFPSITHPTPGRHVSLSKGAEIFPGVAYDPQRSHIRPTR